MSGSYGPSAVVGGRYTEAFPLRDCDEIALSGEFAVLDGEGSLDRLNEATRGAGAP